MVLPFRRVFGNLKKFLKRVRAFIWLVSHGRLLTKERMHRMGLVDDASCTTCGRFIESASHVLRDCQVA